MKTRMCKWIISIPHNTPVVELFKLLSSYNNYLDKVYTCITKYPFLNQQYAQNAHIRVYYDNTYEYIDSSSTQIQFANGYPKHISIDDFMQMIGDEYKKYKESVASTNELSIDDKQRKLDICYLRMAMEWSTNSYCVRRKVGALIVKDKRIISDGYNGTPSGFPNVCEYIPYDTKTEHTIEEIQQSEDMGITTMTHQYVLHAEANAITKLAKSQTSGEGSTLYVTTSPCMECAKLIIQTGIKRVVYTQPYHDLKGIDLMRRVNIDVLQYDTDLITK